jgi:hypothetical protein
LSESTPRNSQRNKLWAWLIASTTRLPSQLTNGRHLVHPVATFTPIASAKLNDLDSQAWLTDVLALMVLFVGYGSSVR